MDAPNTPKRSPLAEKIYQKLCARGVKPADAHQMAVKAEAKAKAKKKPTKVAPKAGAVTKMAADSEGLEFGVPPRLRAAARDKAADQGTAQPDGTWPIRNRSELGDAIRAFGRSKQPAKDKAWILKRAKALGVGPAVLAKIQALGSGAK